MTSVCSNTIAFTCKEVKAWEISILNKRLYFLRQLKRAQVKSEELLLFYLTCIRPVTEYACPVYHHSLPQYLSVDLERCQRQALRIIYPDCSYNEALLLTSLVPGQKTSARPPVRDEYSRILDEWISKSTCPMGRVEFAYKKMFFSTEVWVPKHFGLCKLAWVSRSLVSFHGNLPVFAYVFREYLVLLFQ